MSILLRKIRVALTPRQWRLKTRLSNGPVVSGKNRSGYGGRGVYIFRDAVETEFQHLTQFLEPSDVFVDVGASAGIYTLKAAQHFRRADGLVLALEPFPDVLATLFYNVQANGLTNVRLRNVCAGARTEPGTLWTNFDKPNLFSLIQSDEKASPLAVLTVALDDLFGWEKLNRLDYLKIDVEGAEQQVLAGAKNILQKYRPIIQMEVDKEDAPLDLPDYVAFQAPGSHNKIYLPREHPKFHLPTQLNWLRLDDPKLT